MTRKLVALTQISEVTEDSSTDRNDLGIHKPPQMPISAVDVDYPSSEVSGYVTEHRDIILNSRPGASFLADRSTISSTQLHTGFSQDV